VNAEDAGSDGATSAAGRLPWPEAWPAKQGLWMLLGIGFLALLAAVMVGLAIAGEREGDRAMTIIGSSTAAILILVVAGAAPVHLRMRRRTRTGVITARTTGTGEAGVSMPNSSWLFVWSVALMVMVAGCAAAVAFVVTTTEGAFSHARSLVLLVVGTAAALYGAWFILEVARGKIARGGVVLSPSGVGHRSLFHEEFVGWRDVLDVVPGYDRGPIIALVAAPHAVRRRLTTRLALRRRLPPGVVEIRGTTLAVDPALLLHALTYYRARPDARSELATSVGLQRISGGRLCQS
jgi:hypothetical protein